MNDQISKILNSPHRDKVLVGLGTFLMGAGTGYFLGFRRGRVQTEEEVDRIDAAVRQVTSEYRETDLPDEIIRVVPEPLILDAETFGMNNAGENVSKSIENIDDVKLVNDLDGVEIINVSVNGSDDDEPDIVTQNIFAGTDDEWDYDEEVKTRSEEKPYILHKDEFYENEKDYAQVTLVYYAGDNILVSEDEQIVYNYENITGPLRFGHGSGDTKVLFVRNDKSKAEYEIVRHEGSYSIEVMGLEIEGNARAGDLRHERLSKFRPD